MGLPQGSNIPELSSSCCYTALAAATSLCFCGATAATTFQEKVFSAGAARAAEVSFAFSSSAAAGEYVDAQIPLLMSLLKWLLMLLLLLLQQNGCVVSEMLLLISLLKLLLVQQQQQQQNG